MGLKIRLKYRFGECLGTLLLAVCVGGVGSAQPRTTAPDRPAYLTPFERDTLSTTTYAEAVDYYLVLAKAYPSRCRLVEIGESDTHYPLLAFVISDGDISAHGTASGQSLLINNGIHAGEPCGVDASMMLARELLVGSLGDVALGDNAIVIIPAFNIGGMLNRGGMTRANQNGPKSYGFRGNAQNLDLNRDFVKRDSRNTQTLTRYLRDLDPDVFIDTHTTNGADYQYVMTVIATQYEKLGPVLGPFLRKQMEPALYQAVSAKGHLVVPYVNADGPPQEDVIEIFVESPRYSTGFTSLQHTIGFVSEAHMLKPFAARVRATQAFLESTIEFWLAHLTEIRQLRTENAAEMFAADSVVLQWRVDTTRADTLDFAGYRAIRERSVVTGGERLRYDQQQPIEARVPFRSYAVQTVSVAKPRYYYVPKAYADLVLRDLADSASVLRGDTTLSAVAYHIEDYKTAARPYEGHYLHYGVEVSRRPTQVQAHAGDLLIEVTPANLQVLAATLEPEAPDSYFAWGMFDSWLQAKEHFSGYVFEETAAQMLQQQPRLRTEFEAKRKGDDAFRQNAGAQLQWLYERSENYESGYGRLPVMRVE